MNDNQNNNSNNNGSEEQKKFGTDSYWDKYDAHDPSVVASEDVDEFVVPDEHATGAVPAENSQPNMENPFQNNIPRDDNAIQNPPQPTPPPQNDFSMPQNPDNLGNVVSEVASDATRNDVMDQNINGGGNPSEPLNTDTTFPSPTSDMNQDNSQVPQTPAPELQAPVSGSVPQEPGVPEKSEMESQEPVQNPEENKLPEVEDLPKTPPIGSAFDVSPTAVDSNSAARDVSANEEIKTDRVVKRNRKKPIIAAIAAIAILALGSSVLFYVSSANNAKSALGVTTPSDIKKIVSNVAELVNLPISESPSQIANITDTAKLGGNPFFANAAKGDVVLIYPKNQEAILYRPSTNRVVAIGPLDNKPTQSVAGASTEAAPTPTASPSATPLPTSSPTPTSKTTPKATSKTEVSPTPTP